jgi:hypothetical protein
MNTTDLSDSAKQRAGDVAEGARKAAGGLMRGMKKAAYVAVGAPVRIGRRIASYGERMGDTLRQEIDASIDEGEKLAERLRDRNVVEELKEKVDIDHLQDRVERLRDQLEDVLDHWRENFRPHTEDEEQPAPDPETATVEESAPEHEPEG